jgi:hypothetical protein
VGELDRLRGFHRGCDDYMLKPFSYHELSARVRALLRRTRHRPATGRLRVGTLELDPLSRQVWVRGAPVALSKKEYALLRALAGEPTRVLTTSQSGLSRGARDSRGSRIRGRKPRSLALVVQVRARSNAPTWTAHASGC